MGLKKSYFKGLQNGVNSSPIRQDGVGVDKKFPNIVNQVANDNLVNNNNDFKFKTLKQRKLDQTIENSIFNKPEIDKRDKNNESFRDARLSIMKNKYPEANVEDLKKYLFSNKKGISPEEYINSTGTMFGGKAEMLTDPRLPSDALAVSDNLMRYYGDGIQIADNSAFTISDPLDNRNEMFGLSLEEKQALVKNNINKLNLGDDPRNIENKYQKDTLDNFANWYMDPITQQRLLEQGQFSGNIRSDTYDAGYNFGAGKSHVRENSNTVDKKNNTILKDASNVAGSLVGQADIDNIMSSITDKKFTFNKEKIAGTLGSVDPKTQYRESNLGTFNDTVNIDPSSLKFGDRLFNVNDNLSSSSNQFSPSSSHIKAKQQTGFHELTHATRLDKLMDPFLRSKLVGVGSSDYNQYEYNTKPGELYANFAEFRKSIGMKPGEQFDSKKLKERYKEYNMDNSDFQKNFTEESLIEALNTVAKVDKTIPGKTKFDDLQMMQGDMNTEVA